MLIHASAPNRQPTRDWLTAPAIIAAGPLALPIGGSMSQSAASFADLLRSAVSDPGIVSAAYGAGRAMALLGRGSQPTASGESPRELRG